MVKAKLGAFVLFIAFTSTQMLLTPTAAPASVQGRFERTFDVSGPVDLEVLTHSGDITIRGGAAGHVSITGAIHVSNRWLEGNRTPEVEEVEKNPPIRAATVFESTTRTTTISRLIMRSGFRPMLPCAHEPVPGTRR